jgi:signal transduction histidine kinase
VFLNLVSNAVKYTPAGGEVVVGGQVTATEVWFYVKDSGPGVPPHLMPDLFEPFAKARDRSRSDSVGLGLAIAREIVQLHGGRIWVESQEGQGSTFWFTVPSQDTPTAG